METKETSKEILNRLKGKREMKEAPKKKEEKEKPIKPRKESGLKKYWRDVKSGKIKRVMPWSKKKAKKLEDQKLPEPPKPEIKKEEPKKEEPKKEEPKPEIKLKKTPPDKEAEEIKKELGKEATDEKILKKEPKIEVKKPEIPKIKDSDTNLLIYIAGGIVLLAIILKFLSGKRSSDKASAIEQPSQSKVRDFDMGGGKKIQIPIT